MPGRILPDLAIGDLSTPETNHLKNVVKGFWITPQQANNLIKTLRPLKRHAMDEKMIEFAATMAPPRSLRASTTRPANACPCRVCRQMHNGSDGL